MRKYDKHGLSSSALLAEAYKRITSSRASIPCTHQCTFKSRKQLPAERLLPRLSRPPPPCSYSEILQLPLPYLVAGTVLCLAEPPGPAPAGHPAPRPPARLQRATPPGPRASSGSRRPRPCPCKAHRPRAPAGRGQPAQGRSGAAGPPPAPAPGASREPLPVPPLLPRRQPGRAAGEAAGAAPAVPKGGHGRTRSPRGKLTDTCGGFFTVPEKRLQRAVWGLRCCFLQRQRKASTLLPLSFKERLSEARFTLRISLNSSKQHREEQRTCRKPVPIR